MNDSAIYLARDELETRNIGLSLARSWYRLPGLLLLRGELGAGKTTFVQGFAEGHGVHKRVVSPTYALEQRYDEKLSHVDLYRLKAAEASEFLDSLDDFPGIRVVEWGDRVAGLSPDVSVSITEDGEGRKIEVECPDIRIPSKKETDAWRKEAMLPDHIARHCDCVASVADKIAVLLLKQGRMVRRHALAAAARVHDLLRFVDFKSLTGDEYFTPTKKQSEHWAELKKKYGVPHEAAAERFLIARGYPEIGQIVRTHRGYAATPEETPQTTEQEILAYADKRARFDTVVTLDERFDDFLKRYGKGNESDAALLWRREMKRLETSLFPEGAPF